MKKFKEIFEQHRKEGRFRPVKPHNVQNISLGSPRPSSDSASVKLKEDLRKWFSKTDPAGDWKRINSKGEAIGPCAREPGEPKPKCMSRAKRESLTKKERASAVRAKRKHDPNPERKGEPINVSNFGKGKISENMEKLNKNNLFEKWSQKYKSSIDCNNPKGFSQKAHCAGKEKNINEEKKDQYDEGEYDQEGDMAKSDLRSIMANAKRVHDMLEDSDNLPEWVQSKITKAEDYMSTVANYMEAEMSEEVKTVTVKHKTSGKELVVSPEKAKQLKPQGYHLVKEEDAYSKDRYAVKNGKAVKDNPTHKGSSNYKDQPHHVYATSAEEALKKHMKKESVEQIDELSNKTLYSYLRQTGAIRSSTEVNPRNTSNVPHDLQYQAQDSAKSRINARKGYDSVAPKGYAKEEVEQIEEGIEVKKEYNDKTEAEHGVYHNGKKIGYVVHHKPSGTHTAYHSPQDDDDYGQIDDFRSHHDAVSQIRHSAGVGVHEEVEQIDELSKDTLKSYMKNKKEVEGSGGGRLGSGYSDEKSEEGTRSAIRRLQARKNQIGKYGEVPKVPGYNKEEVEQINEKNVPTSPEKWAQAKSQAKAKFDVYPSAYANGWAAKKYKAMGGSWKSVSEATDPPFDKPYTTIKKVVTDKSGAKHSPMSRARDIARMAMKKQMEKMKPVKESLEESRKAEIVKEIMKKKKDKSEDAFQKDPELTTTLTKGI